MKTWQFLGYRRFILVFTLMLSVGGFLSCDDDEEEEAPAKVNYSGSFEKSSDAVNTSATGTTRAIFDPASSELSFTVTWTGLGSAAANMHFHNDGPVMAPITGFPQTVSGTVSGKVTLTAQQAADLVAGKIYTQIHTATYPAGEVIARLSKSSSGMNPPPSGGNGY
ncbi:MAG: CHRD domain-containing protein [Mangrovibacterium sp.]